VASAIVVEEFGTLAGESDLTIDLLGQVLIRAEERITSLSSPEQRGAGTTVAMVATMRVDGVGYWVVLNLGDSRVYRLADGEFEQVSVDHSVVQELMDRGEITAEEAKVHPYRHMVTRALGAGSDAEADYWLIPAEAGDRLLVCSDGLTGEVDDATIEELLRSVEDLDTLTSDLVHLALESGGHDNVTVVVVQAIDVVEAFAGEDQDPDRDADQDTRSDLS
jgi:protein phosphatase